MARGKRVRRGREASSEAPSPGGRLAAIYEGPEVLTALLAQAGSPLAAEEVAERFAAAQAVGEERGEVIPGLFEDEPRFASPDDARRLYSNLFGLWNRLAAGLGPIDDTPEVAPPAPPPEPLPERGSEDGDRLSSEIVEATWRHLAALRAREAGRLRDRFASDQPDLSAWLDQVELPESGGLAASDLAFEAWAMFDLAFGDRLGAVSSRELSALEAEPPPLEAEQPALGAYAAEQLDNLEGEDPDFGPTERAQVERVVAAVAAALTRAVSAE
jgi:hypothetical protein